MCVLHHFTVHVLCVMNGGGTCTCQTLYPNCGLFRTGSLWGTCLYGASRSAGGSCLQWTLPLHCALAVIPYSGETFKGENFRELVKIQFSQRKLLQIARFCCAKGYHAPPIWWRKLSRIAKKPQNSRKFSPSKVFRYMVVFAGELECWMHLSVTVCVLSFALYMPCCYNCG